MKEGTWISIRTDLIDPHVYLDIEYNYKGILQKIYEFGGYITFTQFIRLYGKSQGAGHKLIRKLVDDLKLLGEQQVNANKYAYLKTRAMQYLKQNLKAKSVDPRPNNHVLLTSIYKAELYLQNGNMLRSEINNDGLSQIEKDLSIKHSIDKPFVNPAAFSEEINNIHYSRCFLYRTKVVGKGLHFNFAVIDFDRSKTWFLNLLRRLDNIMSFLNEDCLYQLDILVKNQKRQAVVKDYIRSLLKDNEYRKEIRNRMLKSNSPTARVRVNQMNNLIFNYCEKIDVVDLNIERFFMHPSQFSKEVYKISEVNKLLQIREDILSKMNL